MKKFIFTTLSILFLTVLVSSCNLVTVTDDDLVDAPSVSTSAGGVAVTVYRYSSDTQYINIYRKDLSSSDEEPKIIKIGLIFPATYDSSSKSYFLEDKLVYPEHKYVYSVRYTEKDGKTYNSAWSKEAVAAGSYNSESVFAYKNDGTAKFIYNDTDYTLTIQGILLSPSIAGFDSWCPMLAVRSDRSSQVFKLEKIESGTTINLRGLLSSEFLNTEIEIIGILAQNEITMTDSDGTSKTQMLIWTEPTAVEVSSPAKDNKITIKSETGTSGFDFS